MSKRKGIGGFIGSIFLGGKTPKDKSSKEAPNRERVLQRERNNTELEEEVRDERVKPQPKQRIKPQPKVEKEKPVERRPKVKPRAEIQGKDREQEAVQGNTEPPIRKEIKKVPPTRQNVQQTQEYDVNRQYYPEEDSKEIYGKKTMEQNLFVYAPPTKFLSIQRYINDSFDGIVAVGTSNLSMVEEEFGRKINCKHMLLFVDTDADLEGVVGLIKDGIRIKGSNPELLHIYVIVTSKEVKVSRIKALKGSNLLNLFAINSGIAKLSTGIIDQIMTKVVEKQPAYVRQEKIEVPRMAVRTKTIDKEVFKLKNINELRESINRVRQQSEMKSTGNITDKLTYATSRQDIEDVKNMIPELSVLEEYRESLNEYLEMSGGELPTDKLNEILLSKLELTMLQEQTLRDIFDTIINTSNAEEQDEMVRRTNENLMEEYKPLSEDEDLNKLLLSRAELKDKITVGFKRYKEEVQLISNTIETRRFMIQELQQDTLQLTSLGDDVDPAIKDTALAMIDNLETSKLTLLEDKSNVEERLLRTVNYTNSLFRDYKVIVSLDEIIIDKLVEDNQRLAEHSVNKIYTVDNPLKAKAKTMYLIHKEGIMNLTRAMFAIDTLIVTDQDVELGKRMVKQSIEEFVKDYSDKNCNLVKIEGTESEEQMKLMVDKLKYLSNSFNKIVFLIDISSNQELKTLSLDNSSEIVYMLEPHRKSLIELNEIRQIVKEKEIFGTTVIINNWNKDDETQPSLGEIRTLGDLRDGVKEIFISTNDIKETEDARKIILLIRSIL